MISTNGLRRLAAVGRRFNLGVAHAAIDHFTKRAGLAVGLRAVCAVLGILFPLPSAMKRRLLIS